MTDTLNCYPSGCSTCHWSRQGGCQLMQVLDVNGVVTMNQGPGATRVEHPIEAFAATA